MTVNLTALLVLTTLFISVSGTLPTTSYVKLVDVWLIFSQAVPFIEVLLHTWMDTRRVDEDRQINHHGVPRPVEKKDNSMKTRVKPNNINQQKGLYVILIHQEIP